MDVSLDDVKEAQAQARQQRSNLRETDAGITDDQSPDWENETVIDDVKGHAEAIVGFDHVSRISINDYGNDDDLLAMEQNLQGAGQFGYTAEITVANPRLLDGQLWRETDAEYPSFKVIGDPEAEGNNHELRESVLTDEDGTVTGSETEGIFVSNTSKWDGQPVAGGFTELDADHATIEISASRAMDVLGVLDTAGLWYRGPDGEVQEGLFEAPPAMGTDEYDADTHGYPRLVGYPELRQDMVGQQGAIAFTLDDSGQGNARKEVTILNFEDGDMDALVPLQPDDDAYALPTYPRSNNRYWDEHGDGDGGSVGGGPTADDGDHGADADPETSGGMEAAKSAFADAGSDDDDDETDFEDLTEAGQSFVEDATEAMDAHGLESITELDEGEDTDYEDFAERVETTEAAADGTLGADADTLSAIIDRHAEA